MKDRFKTRIFDKTTNTMHYNDFVITSTGYVAKLERVNLAEAYNKSPELWNSENDTLFINQEDFDFDEKMIVMQCTGLKDKNGKLIYEGDIIRDEHSEAVAIIEWLSYAYSLMAHVRGMDDYLPLEDICYALEVATPFEVIGNIYENKELLND